MKNLILTAAALLSLSTLTIQASNSLPKHSGINPATVTPSPAVTTPAAVVPTTAAVQTTISMCPSHNGGGTVQVTNTNQPITISVADLSGKNVFEKTITGNSYDLAGIMKTSGIYIISIKQNDAVISSKTWIVTK